MFGRHESISELWSQFQLDYFEYDDSEEFDSRWSDRITTDGTWSGNLFDFFFLVLPRLRQGLKRPFRLNDDLVRVENTPADTAIREALANALVHADYWEPSGIRIELRPNGIKLINPGTLLVSKESLFTIEDQVSICRNKSIQKMFQTLGLVDKAGSGMEKIVKGWLQHRISMPDVQELSQPTRVVWLLPFAGMASQEKFNELSHINSIQIFNSLSIYEKLIMLNIPFDSYVKHNEIKQVLPHIHSADISKYLARLVSLGYLKTKGNARGMQYRLQRAASPSRTEEISQLPGEISQLPGEISQLPGEISQLPGEISQLPASVLAIQGKKWVQKKDREKAIKDLCVNRWISIHDLMNIFQRDRRTLQLILQPMVEYKVLQTKHPQLNHPQQAYTLNSSLGDATTSRN